MNQSHSLAGATMGLNQICEEEPSSRVCLQTGRSRFHLRDLFWLVLVIAMGLGWMRTSNRLSVISRTASFLQIEQKKAWILEDYIVGDLGGNVLWRRGGDDEECVWAAIEMNGEQGVTGLCTDPWGEVGERRGIPPDRRNAKPWPIPYYPGSYALKSRSSGLKTPDQK